MKEPEVTTDANQAQERVAARPPVDVSADVLVDVSVDIAAGVEAVWEALVTDGGLEPWMGDGATIDPRPGGRLILPDPVGGRPRAGLVDVIEDCSQLRFTWWPMTRPADRSTVAITVEPTETGTRVTVREAAPASVGAKAASSAILAGSGAGTAQNTIAPATPSRRLPMRSVVPGFWAWRLATLAVSFQMARV